MNLETHLLDTVTPGQMHPHSLAMVTPGYLKAFRYEDKEQEAEDGEDLSYIELANTKGEEAKEDTSALNESESKIYETFLTQGEMSLGNQNYTQIMEHLIACLINRQEKLPIDSCSITNPNHNDGVRHSIRFYEFNKYLGPLLDTAKMGHGKRSPRLA